MKIKIRNYKDMAVMLKESEAKINEDNIRFVIEEIQPNEQSRLEIESSIKMMARLNHDIDSMLWNWYQRALEGEFDGPEPKAGVLKFIPKEEAEAMIERLQSASSNH